VALGLLVWQAVVASGWKPDYLLPGPAATFGELGKQWADGSLPEAMRNTMALAAQGFGLALVIGTLLGICISASAILRRALGSLITGLQTMPSIAWFPLAIVLFVGGEKAIFFVVVLGAAPSVANGIIHGIDHIPPILLNVGRVLGARGLAAYRYVVLPAAFPSFVGGLKQGWAFSWRSLMAGELLVSISEGKSLGHSLEDARTLSNYPGLLATMVVILLIGIVVDALFFGRLEKLVRQRWGLKEAT
ncbi:MAG: ABC transporter permease, partial [Actinomycetota bacterium]